MGNNFEYIGERAFLKVFEIDSENKGNGRVVIHFLTDEKRGEYISEIALINRIIVSKYVWFKLGRMFRQRIRCVGFVAPGLQSSSIRPGKKAANNNLERHAN